MKNILNNTGILKLSKSFMIVMIINFSISCSVMRDNAVNLAYDLEAAAKTLKSQKIGSEFVINYKPLDTEAPFTILIFSEKGVTFDELIEKGLDPTVAKELGEIEVAKEKAALDHQREMQQREATAQDATANTDEKGNNKWVWIGLGILLLGIAAFFIIKKVKANKLNTLEKYLLTGK